MTLAYLGLESYLFNEAFDKMLYLDFRPMFQENKITWLTSWWAS